MIIRCTQKLLSQLQTPLTPELSTSEDPFWSWHGNLLLIEKRKCVVLVNDFTLFTIFIPGLKKPDFNSFDIIFGQSLFKNLLYENIPQVQIELILSNCKDLMYTTINNRKVLGSMNEQIKVLDYFISSEGGLQEADIHEVNRELNRNILSFIANKRPIEVLKKKLQELSE